MNCPVDTAMLETHVLDPVTVEECPQCRGLWFNQDELRRAKDAAKPDLNWLDFDLWSEKDKFDATWSSRKCPQCKKKMATIGYCNTGVGVDYCIEGHGMWLEKGELEAIVERLDAEANSKTLAEYVSASLAEARGLLTGDEGLVSEWRDLASVIRLLEYRLLIENPRLARLLSALQSSTPFR
jgi:Zn-finger nucleic acid-binding protein